MQLESLKSLQKVMKKDEKHSPFHVWKSHDTGVADPYTVAHKDDIAHPNKYNGLVDMLGMSENPTHPSYGVSQFSMGQVGEHLGEKIPFHALPQHLQDHIKSRYAEPSSTPPKKVDESSTEKVIDKLMDRLAKDEGDKDDKKDSKDDSDDSDYGDDSDDKHDDNDGSDADRDDDKKDDKDGKKTFSGRKDKVEVKESSTSAAPKGYHIEALCPYCGKEHDREGASCCKENHVTNMHVSDTDPDDIRDPYEHKVKEEIMNQIAQFLSRIVEKDEASADMFNTILMEKITDRLEGIKYSVMSEITASHNVQIPSLFGKQILPAIKAAKKKKKEEDANIHAGAGINIRGDTKKYDVKEDTLEERDFILELKENKPTILNKEELHGLKHVVKKNDQKC